MGVFGAVFERSGDVGFTVATWLCPVREKVRPARSDGGSEREKVRPAHEKWPKIGVFWCAGRVFSRTGSCGILRGELCCAVGLVTGSFYWQC